MDVIGYLKKFYKYYIKKSLITERLLKRKLCYVGNNVIIEAPIRLGACPRNITIEDNTTILSNARLNSFSLNNGHQGSIYIGSGCYIGYRFSILAGADVTIGENVLIASDVTISAENHGFDPENQYEYMNQSLNGESVSIGDGCWIGEKVCILSGVNIGKKSVIGACSVVTSDVPDYSIAVGNPAHVIKKYSFKNHRWEFVE